MKLSHNQLLPKTHLCQNCDRVLLSTPVHRCRLFIREPRNHAPLGIQTWNVINMRLNKRLGHDLSKMGFCVYILKLEFVCEVRPRMDHLKQRRFTRMNNFPLSLSDGPLSPLCWLFYSGKRLSISPPLIITKIGYCEDLCMPACESLKKVFVSHVACRIIWISFHTENPL